MIISKLPSRLAKNQPKRIENSRHYRHRLRLQLIQHLWRQFMRIKARLKQYAGKSLNCDRMSIIYGNKWIIANDQQPWITLHQRLFQILRHQHRLHQQRQDPCQFSIIPNVSRNLKLTMISQMQHPFLIIITIIIMSKHPLQQDVHRFAIFFKRKFFFFSSSLFSIALFRLAMLHFFSTST